MILFRFAIRHLCPYRYRRRSTRSINVLSTRRTPTKPIWAESDTGGQTLPFLHGIYSPVGIRLPSLPTRPPSIGVLQLLWQGHKPWKREDYWRLRGGRVFCSARHVYPGQLTEKELDELEESKPFILPGKIKESIRDGEYGKVVFRAEKGHDNWLVLTTSHFLMWQKTRLYSGILEPC